VLPPSTTTISTPSARAESMLAATFDASLSVGMITEIRIAPVFVDRGGSATWG
jgi:hypothetical protein